MARPITAVAARAAALRRTFMIGGCLSLRGAGQRGTDPGRLGSADLDGAMRRRDAGAREPFTYRAG
ncbi:hypothetical protein Stsp02_63910 [Streptomyces sp. NBRC 14336]|nr:hypothetical protein Stsp02_63910 [Streptomyces sp. NBRC 14336]